MAEKRKADFLIVGSGFTGSLFAMILSQLGYKVMVLESGEHPRFTIGESSTPLADMILRSLAHDYDLPWLLPFSRYGNWIDKHPNIDCGLKRGFSYFFHQQGQPYHDDVGHTNAMLVAASTSDRLSDTHWYRPHFDFMLVKKLREYGVLFYDDTRIRKVRKSKSGSNWIVDTSTGMQIEAGFITDATGGPAFAETFLGDERSCEGFFTNSGAVYSHFDHVEFWQEYLTEKNHPVGEFPFHADHSALHHLLDEGWMWMLRFRSGKLSAGFMIDQTHAEGKKLPDFQEMLNRYPSLKEIFGSSVICEFAQKNYSRSRIQFRLKNGFGDRWHSLGASAGFVDPMHSTGIAQALSAVERAAGSIRNGGVQGFNRDLAVLHGTFKKELELIDRLAATAYRSRSNPALFEACVMLYFVCSIASEQERLSGKKPESFLNAHDPVLSKMIGECCKEVIRWDKNGNDPNEACRLTHLIREKITPWNTAGLLDPSKNRMYEHTAVTVN